MTGRFLGGAELSGGVGKVGTGGEGECGGFVGWVWRIGWAGSKGDFCVVSTLLKWL